MTICGWLCKIIGLSFSPFAFAALNFAHRSFVAFEIFALAAADITVSSHQSFYHCYCQRFTAAIHTSQGKLHMQNARVHRIEYIFVPF